MLSEIRYGTVMLGTVRSKVLIGLLVGNLGKLSLNVLIVLVFDVLPVIRKNDWFLDSLDYWLLGCSFLGSKVSWQQSFKVSWFRMALLG